MNLAYLQHNFPSAKERKNTASRLYVDPLDVDKEQSCVLEEYISRSTVFILNCQEPVGSVVECLT